MMNLRESVDLRVSKLGSEKACGGVKRKEKESNTKQWRQVQRRQTRCRVVYILWYRELVCPLCLSLWQMLCPSGESTTRRTQSKRTDAES